MSREEVILLITETLEHHPDFEMDDEDGGETSATPREKARLLLDKLLRHHWLDEPPRRDWRRTIHFDAHGATLITALRKIAWPDAAVFTDKLIAVCAMLADETELSERPWQTVENCLSNVREGLNELRTMQKSVQRFTRRQLEEETLKGNLETIFDDYSEQMSHACYAELVRARLPLRLPEAVNRIANRLMGDSTTISEMQTEVLRRHPAMSAETARCTVLNALDELIDLVERVLPMADEIDRRTVIARRLPVQPGAQQSIENQVAVFHVLERPALHIAARFAPARRGGRCIPLQASGIFQCTDHGFQASFSRQPGNDIAITAIIAFTCHDQCTR
jgi:hypothetical protein